MNRRTGVAREIVVRGGPRPVSGDGLVLRGDTLFDVRGSGGNDVSVFRLRRRNGRWVATAQGTLTDATLDVPSTATFATGSLWAVNARFGVASPDTASYWVTRLETALTGRHGHRSGELSTRRVGHLARAAIDEPGTGLDAASGCRAQPPWRGATRPAPWSGRAGGARRAGRHTRPRSATPRRPGCRARC